MYSILLTRIINIMLTIIGAVSSRWLSNPGGTVAFQLPTLSTGITTELDDVGIILELAMPRHGILIVDQRVHTPERWNKFQCQ